MVNLEQHRRRSHPRVTFIAIGLMILAGAIIIFLDRNQVKQLAGKAEWNYLVVALGFVVVSYLAQSIGMVVMLRVFGTELNNSYLLRVGFVSNVLSNLIALPASLALRLLVLSRHGVTQSQNVGSSLLLSYFKNIVYSYEMVGNYCRVGIV